MQRFENVLYYVAPGETSGAALEHTVALARRNECAVRLLGVMEPVSRLVAPVIPGHAGLDRMIADHQQAALDELAERARADGLDVSVRLRRGRPFLEIIREVLEEGHDLVVKAAQGDAGSGGALGTTALHLLRKCPCPVWVIEPGTRRFRRIVAAVDPAQSDEAQAALQRRIVQLGRSLAETYDASLTVVHAWELFGESLLRSRTSASELEAILAATRGEARASLDALARDTSLDPDRLALIKGHHGQAVARYLEESGADLVVLGTLSRSGVPGLLIGNTAERILKGLDCSVLAVKPEGFVSPVTVAETVA